MNASGRDSLREAEDALANGATDLALLHLWNALERAETFDDRQTLARIVQLAERLSPSNDEATEIAASARQALDREEPPPATVPASAEVPTTEEAAEAPYADRDAGGPERGGAARGRSVRARVLTALLGLAVIVGLQLGARMLIHRWGDDAFGPPIKVVPTGQGYTGPKPISREGFYLVLVDGTPTALVQRIARTVRVRYRLSASVLPRVLSEQQTLDRKRHQLEAAALLDELFRAYPTTNPRSVIVGVTNLDLYWSGAAGDRFAFGVRAGDRYGIVSTARMDPRNYGDRPNPRLVGQRVEKMLLRYLGELFFRLPRNDDERSLLRGSIRKLGDLDEMTTEFCPDRPGTLTSC